MVVLTQRETIIVLHGLGQTRWNMLGLTRALRRAGYDVVPVTYPSLRFGIDALAGFLYHQLVGRQIMAGTGKIHFVTHSMGGLVVRAFLARYGQTIPPGKIGRFVMIAPPNGGSEIADALHRLSLYRWLYGPAGQALRTAARTDLAAPDRFETGIIAGAGGRFDPVARLLMPAEPHDGRVSVARTRLHGMKDHVTVAAGHSFIAWRGNVHRQALRFLQQGHFDHVE